MLFWNLQRVAGDNRYMFFSHKLKGLFVILSVVFLPLSCMNPSYEKTLDIKLVQCATPKPNVCTREYQPVCGFESDGNHKTFGNACEACANTQVTNYYSGACQ